MHVLDTIDDRQIDELTARHEFFWLDVVGASDERIRALGRHFGWHPLVVQDTIEFRQRPKLDRYDDQMLIVFYGAKHLHAEEPELIEVHVIVSGDWVVTVRRSGCDDLDDLRKRITADESAGEQFVVYRILDTLTDTFFPVMEKIDEAIDSLEDAIVQKPDDEQLQQLFRLKRRLVALRRVITPQRDLAARTIDEIAELPGLDPASRDYFRDVYDHLIRVSDMVDSYRDLLSGAMDVYLSTVSNRLNSVMRQLTVVATIFLPITALTGFFGQNFGWLVRHIQSESAFFGFGVGGIVLSFVLLMLWFRRQRLLS
ncbi:MAG: magnesium and cobalt transport protein CorA [Conexibacter sp.]|jgi:magnesium transporter|nr:magnesium and cobalt transport protein CorA [Conexibacter sp.]